MPAGGEQERMDDQIGLITGSKRFTSYLIGDGEDVVADRTYHGKGICTLVVEPLADHLGIACQGQEGRAGLSSHEPLKTMRRGQLHLVPGILQADRQR